MKDTLPRGWIAVGNEKLWGEGGTYTRVPYELLPPLTGLDGTFSFLQDVEVPYPMGFDQEEGEPVPLDARVKEAKRAGFTVPASFLTFLRDEALHGSVSSCTACYYDLGDRLVALPNGSALLRFMNDQQSCCFWFLLLHKDGTHQVATAWPEWKDDPDGDSVEDACVLQEVTVCAESFEEFIKRFWIENLIWSFTHSQHERPLEGELHAYVEAARSAKRS